MPRRMVCPVSRSVSRCSEGSARTILPSADPNFSCSVLFFDFTETLMTGSGKRMRSSTTGAAVSHKVSPVSVSANDTKAMMSPARASSTGLASLANISTMRPIFSRLPRVEFMTDAPFVSTPEYTRTKVNAP